MSALTSILSINLDVLKVNNQIYISRASLFRLISDTKKMGESDLRLVRWIPKTYMEHTILVSNTTRKDYYIKRTMPTYSLQNALIFLEYIRQGHAQLRMMLIQIIRDHFEEYLT